MAFAVACLTLGNLWADGPWLEISAVAGALIGTAIAHRIRMLVLPEALLVWNPMRKYRIGRGEGVIVERSHGASLAGGGHPVPCLRAKGARVGDVAIIATVRLHERDFDAVERVARSAMGH